MSYTLSPEQFNRIMSAVAVVEQSAPEEFSPKLRRPSPTRYQGIKPAYIGQVVSAGPNNEADLDGAMYWVERQALDIEAMRNSVQPPLGPTDPLPKDTHLIFKPVNTNPKDIVVGHMLDEYGSGANGEGLHAINLDLGGKTTPPRYLLVIPTVISGWVIHSLITLPGQMFSSYGYFVASCDAQNCPTGIYVETAGPSVVSTQAPPGCT